MVSGLTNASDAAERSRLRLAAAKEVTRVGDSYVAFDRGPTAWDTSFLRSEVTRGNGESMLVSREQSSRTFYLFVTGRLRKVYRVFDPLVFPEGNFAEFAAALQRRFGPARARERVRSPTAVQRWVEWQAGTTRLRALDNSRSYGFYCLLFEDMTARRAAQTKRVQR